MRGAVMTRRTDAERMQFFTLKSRWTPTATKDDIVVVLYRSGNMILAAHPDLVTDEQTMRYPRLSLNTVTPTDEYSSYVRLISIPGCRALNEKSIAELAHLLLVHADRNRGSLRRTSSVSLDLNRSFSTLEEIFHKYDRAVSADLVPFLLSTLVIRSYLAAEQVISESQRLMSAHLRIDGNFTKFRNVAAFSGMTDDDGIADLFDRCDGNLLLTRTPEQFEFLTRVIRAVRNTHPDDLDSQYRDMNCIMHSDGSGMKFFNLLERSRFDAEKDTDEMFHRIMKMSNDDDCYEMKNIYHDRSRQDLNSDASFPMRRYLTTDEAAEAFDIVNFFENTEDGARLLRQLDPEMVSFIAYLIIEAHRNNSMSAVEDVIYELEHHDLYQLRDRGFRKFIKIYVNEENSIPLAFALTMDGVEWRTARRGLGYDAHNIDFV